MSRFTSRRWLIAGCLTATIGTVTAVVTSAGDHGKKSGYVVISDGDEVSASQAYLGVSVQRLRSRLREALDIPSDVSGLMITNVHDDTPAEEAGLQNQDVILRVNSQPVNDEDDFTDLIRSFKPETHVSISIWRNGHSKDIPVTLGRRPRMRLETWGKGDVPRAFSWSSDENDEGAFHARGIPTPPQAPAAPAVPRVPGMNRLDHPGNWNLHTLGQLGGRGRLGIEIQDLNEDIAPYFGVEKAQGVLVWRVRDGSPADLAGMKAGDVIVEIEGKAIDSTAELREEMADHDEGESMAITWLRRGQSLSAGVELEERDGSDTYMFSERPRRRAAQSAPAPDASRSMDRIEREMEALQRRMEALQRDMERLKD